jgi:hypothetical protein
MVEGISIENRLKAYSHSNVPTDPPGNAAVDD